MPRRLPADQEDDRNKESGMGVLSRRMTALTMFGLACAAAATAASVARAEDDYPNHAVRWLVGYPPGGSTDICARLIGQYLSEHLHQQFAVENKPGAGNNLATEMAVNAPPDGSTVFLVNPANAINASLYKNLSFNFIADMAPVAGFIRVPNVMEVNPDVPAHTVKEFIDYAKANPGKVNMASSGIGTSVHLSGALFMMMTGAEMVHVPYRGAAPALTDMLANQVQVMFDNLPASPRAVIDKLNHEINAALAEPAMQAKLAEIGGILIPGTPEDFGKIIAAETEKWSKVVKATGATAE
jgi:tripartite-type tricarboxylate transporter receptor subunit TctC